MVLTSFNNCVFGEADSDQTTTTTTTTTTSVSAVQEPVVRKTQSGAVQPAKSTTPVPGNDIASGKVPEGFFDNVDADHRARGLEPPKVDIK